MIATIVKQQELMMKPNYHIYLSCQGALQCDDIAEKKKKKKHFKDFLVDIILKVDLSSTKIICLNS